MPFQNYQNKTKRSCTHKTPRVNVDGWMNGRKLARLSRLAKAGVTKVGFGISCKLSPFGDFHRFFFVCFFEVLRPNGVMSSTVSLPNHPFIGQA